MSGPMTGPGLIAVLMLAAGITLLHGDANGAPEQASREDISDLVEHARGLPPSTYDIEVISEFSLQHKSEETIRAAVLEVFSRSNRGAKSQTPEEITQEADREVRRLLAEQEAPRRIRKRCRYSKELGYRVEMVTERASFEDVPGTGPVEEAPYQDGYVNVGSAESEDTRSVTLQLDNNVAILNVESGARVPNEHVWTGGTVGWPVLVLLRSALRIGQPEEQEQIALLEQGEFPNLKVLVERNVRLPDGTSGRRFILRVSADGQTVEVNLTVPLHSFNPVWKVEFPNGYVPREVLESKGGVAQVWIDRDMAGNASLAAVASGEKKYTLISRALNVPLDPDLFAFKPPEGFTYEDHSVNPPRIVLADGTERIGKPIERTSDRKASSRWMWLFFGNLLMLAAGVLMVVVARRRGRPKTGTGGI
ncbi:MAG: hypothetical protein ACK5Q5_13420 [Planctomycetaceae bacterium]